MSKRICGLLFVVLLIIFRAGQSSATETYSCVAGDDIELMFHFGSEGLLSDLQAYESQRFTQPYIYSSGDFTTFKITEPSSKEPFRIKLVRSNSSKAQPGITIDIRGTVGEVIFKGRRYKVNCDFDD